INFFFFFQAEDGIRNRNVTGVQACALPIPGNSNRPQVVEAAKLFRAHVVDVSPDSLIIEATGTPSKLQALLDVLEPFGIRELIESSVTAMSRGPRSMAPSR